MVPQKAESSHHAHLTAARAWLEHFPDNRRSPIANWHHHAVRTGAHTPETVIQQVHQEAQRRLQWTSHPAERVHLQTVLEALQSDRTGALAYAASIIVYEQLPYEARQRVKAERAFPYVQEAMRGQPVTDKQAAYLRALGYTGVQPEDRAAASALIDHLTREGTRTGAQEVQR